MKAFAILIHYDNLPPEPAVATSRQTDRTGPGFYVVGKNFGGRAYDDDEGETEGAHTWWERVKPTSAHRIIADKAGVAL